MITSFTFTEIGDHSTNEDAFAVQQHPLDPNLWILVIADGQGGRSGGGQAAKMACATAMNAATNELPKRLRDGRTWSNLLHQVDEAVVADDTAGFTTFVGLSVSSDRIVGVSSGDSAALLVTAEEATELTKQQRKNPPIGSGDAVAVMFDVNPDVPYRLLAMTDGVWKYVGWERVIQTARSEVGPMLVEKLQKAARLPGSGRFQDDFTVVMLEVSDKEVGERGALAP